MEVLFSKNSVKKRNKKYGGALKGILILSASKLKSLVDNMKNKSAKLGKTAADRVLKSVTGKGVFKSDRIKATPAPEGEIAPGNIPIIKPDIPAHVWNKMLMDSADFDLAINTILETYKLSQGVTRLSPVDAMRLGEHITMKCLVKSGTITESEYDKWLDLK